MISRKIQTGRNCINQANKHIRKKFLCIEKLWFKKNHSPNVHRKSAVFNASIREIFSIQIRNSVLFFFIPDSM